MGTEVVDDPEAGGAGGLALDHERPLEPVAPATDPTDRPVIAPAPTAPDRRTGPVRRALRRHRRDALVVLGISVLVSPVLYGGPLAGLDGSYRVALHLAARDHLVHGRDLVFPFGPLGFTSVPVYVVPRTWLLAAVAVQLSVVALAAVAYRLVGRRLPWWQAAAATTAVLAVVRVAAPPVNSAPAVVLQALAVLSALAFVTRSPAAVPSARVEAGTVAALGALVGFTLLVKTDAGVFAFAVLATAVAADALLTRRSIGWSANRLGVFVGATVATVVGLWLLSGQAPSALGPWLVASAWLTSGFGEAMGVEQSGRGADYLIVLILVAWLVVGMVRARTVDVRSRLATGAVVAVTTYLAFRQGFTRHDGHVVIFGCLVLVLGLGLTAVWGARRSVAFCSAVLLALVAVLPLEPDRVAELAPSVREPLAVARLALDAADRVDTAEANAAGLRDGYGLGSSFLAPARSGTVHISPWDTTVVAAHPELRWHPLPVFQDYSAYTTGLDELNRAALAAGSRPDFILRQSGPAVDNRVFRWEPPAASLEMVCRYREIGAERTWLLLAATPDRCGEPATVAAGSVPFATPVTVPDGDGITVVRFSGINGGLGARLRTVLHKAPEVYVGVGDGSWHRFVPGTQGSWHILRAPACARRILDGGAPDIASFTFSSAADRAAGGASVGYEIGRIPFTC